MKIHHGDRENCDWSALATSKQLVEIVDSDENVAQVEKKAQ